MHNHETKQATNPAVAEVNRIKELAGIPPDDEKSDKLPFPIEALPPVMRNMVIETSKASQAPESLVAMNALGALSAAIGAGYIANSGGDRQTPANLFIMGIAQSGTGKGQAFNYIFKPFREAEMKHAQNWNTYELPKLRTQLAMNEERLKQIKKEINQTDTGPNRDKLIAEYTELERQRDQLDIKLMTPPGFSVADITRESLAVTLSTQPGEALASLSPEARGVIDVLGGRYSQKGSSDEDVYLSAYSRESILINRINRPATQLSHPTLSILWLIQPDAAHRMLGNISMVESGLFPRFLTVNSHAELQDEPEYPYSVDLETSSKWGSLLTDILSKVRANGHTPRIINHTQEAYSALRHATNLWRSTARNGGENYDIVPFAARWGENAWRIALVLHTAEYGSEAHVHPLSDRTANMAIDLMNWLIEQQISFLVESRENKEKLRLYKLLSILENYEGSKTLRMLKKDNGFEHAEVKKLAKKFPAKLRIERVSTNGRPSTIAINLTNKP